MRWLSIRTISTNCHYHYYSYRRSYIRPLDHSWDISHHQHHNYNNLFSFLLTIENIIFAGPMSFLNLFSSPPLSSTVPRVSYFVIQSHPLFLAIFSMSSPIDYVHSSFFTIYHTIILISFFLYPLHPPQYFSNYPLIFITPSVSPLLPLTVQYPPAPPFILSPAPATPAIYQRNASPAGTWPRRRMQSTVL